MRRRAASPRKPALFHPMIQPRSASSTTTRRERSLQDIAIERCGFALGPQARYDYLLGLPEKDNIPKAIRAAMDRNYDIQIASGTPIMNSRAQQARGGDAEAEVEHRAVGRRPGSGLERVPLLGQRGRVPRRHEQSRDAVLDDLRRAVHRKVEPMVIHRAQPRDQHRARKPWRRGGCARRGL